MARLRARTRRMAAAACALAALLCTEAATARTLAAQPPPPGVVPALDAARAQRGAQLEVRLLTFANGEVLWERFGHDAIAIRDVVTGRDYAYNWGMFDFDQPNFLSRFLTGDTRYWMAPFDTDAMIAAYRAGDRTVREQVLDLTPVEAAALLEFVEWNAQEANRYYRYDYYRDNCTTRVRDAIDRVLGGRLRTAFDSLTPAGTTWRDETARVTEGDWAPWIGIHLALGREADETLVVWDEVFLPERLADAIAKASIREADGTQRALVRDDRVLYRAERAPLPPAPPSHLAEALVVSVSLAALITALGAAMRAGAWWARTMLRVLGVVWYGLTGVLGTLLLLAGTVTKHAPYMGSNLSLWQVHPLLLLVAFAAVRAGGTGTLAGLATRGAAFAAMLSLFGAALQATFLPQQSWIITVVTVAVHVAFAAAWRAPGVVPPTTIALEARAAA